MSQELNTRLKNATAWTAGGHVVAQVIKLVSNLVMTYLLAPSDFGVMAIVGVLLVGITLLSDVGIAQNLIAHPQGADPKFRNTVWSFQVVRGVGTWLLACLAALVFVACNHWGLFASDSVYADPRLPGVIVGTFLQSVIQGLQPTKFVIAQRNVTVREMVLLRVYAQVAALVPMFLVAWWFHSVWALVVGGLAAALVQVILSHLMIPGEADKWAWDQEVLDEIWRFGRWIAMSSFIGFVAGCGDRFLLGHYLNVADLGIYSIAMLLTGPLNSVFSMIVNSVAFPALSEVRRSAPEQFPQTYQRFQRYADLFTAGGTGLLAAMAPAIVQWLYKPAFHAAGDMLAILSLTLLGQRFYVIEQCYLSMGEPRLMTAANTLRMLALCLGVPAGYHLGGIHGAVIGVGLATFAAWPIALWFRHHHRLASWRHDLILVPIFAAGYAAGAGGTHVLALLPRIHH